MILTSCFASTAPEPAWAPHLPQERVSTQPNGNATLGLVLDYKHGVVELMDRVWRAQVGPCLPRPRAARACALRMQLPA
mgnify:CR=1 FL=1